MIDYTSPTMTPYDLKMMNDVVFPDELVSRFNEFMYGYSGYFTGETLEYLTKRRNGIELQKELDKLDESGVRFIGYIEYHKQRDILIQQIQALQDIDTLENKIIKTIKDLEKTGLMEPFDEDENVPWSTPPNLQDTDTQDKTDIDNAYDHYKQDKKLLDMAQPSIEIEEETAKRHFNNESLDIRGKYTKLQKRCEELEKEIISIIPYVGETTFSPKKHKELIDKYEGLK